MICLDTNAIIAAINMRRLRCAEIDDWATPA